MGSRRERLDTAPACQECFLYGQSRSLIHSLVPSPIHASIIQRTSPGLAPPGRGLHVCVWIQASSAPPGRVQFLLPKPACIEDFPLHQVLGRYKWNQTWFLAFGHLHCLRETPETLQRGRGLGTPGAGQGHGPASCTCNFVEKGTREAGRDARSSKSGCPQPSSSAQADSPWNTWIRGSGRGGHEALSPLSPHTEDLPALSN